jgi:hypothetical protein
MVRVKIAYKDITKIPKQRLFEMNNKLYLIQFIVESGSDLGDEEGDEGGGDNGDLDNEDDSGMEEFQHDSIPDSMNPTEDKGQPTSNPSQSQRNMS